ncbi:MAG: asparagine synthase (glutamine-hydrolyzing) [Rhodospirillales bacterium]
MCGLAALFAYADAAPPVARAELSAIRDAMRARGPDGEGLWISNDGRVGLAHRRLAVIDLTEAAAQPMACEAGRYRITYNGEIYNFEAIRQRLESEGHVFETRSDTEVLLHLYRRFGADMTRQLRGMYAFAIWDDAKKGLFLARDPFGIKPLYYADDGKTFRAASQVKALRAGGVAGNGVDAAGHVGFYLFGYVPEPHTLYADIRALPAGHTLWVDRHGVGTPHRFFDAGADLALPDPAPGAQARDGAEDLRAALKDSIAHHFVSDVPVGVFLSAGIDSAALAAHASVLKGASLRTLTLGFEEFKGTDRDEVPLAEQVAAALKTHHTTTWVTRADFLAETDAVLRAMDQPSIDGVNTYFVAKAARDAGLKVAISGLGGDELFGGYDSFTQIPKLVAGLGWIPGARPLGRAVRAVAGRAIKPIASPKYAGVLEYGTRYGDAYLLRRGLFMPWELTDVLDADLARAGWRALAPLLRLEADTAAIREPKRKIAALEMGWYMRNQLLRDADWAGMAHSLEIRVPLVDSHLFARLAPGLGRPGGPDKQALAQSPDIALPAAVLNRPKTGFFVPVHDWLRAEEAPPAAGSPDRESSDRGLRGWARRVYRSAVK